MSTAGTKRPVWDRISPLFSGLLWAIPVALWTGVVLDSVTDDVPAVGLLLLLPALVAAIVMLLAEKYLSWAGKSIATLAGFGLVAAIVLVSVPSSTAVDAILTVLVPLAWLAVMAAPLLGHGHGMRMAGAHSEKLRFAPVGAWTALVGIWVVIQTSPTSSMATDGPFLEVQMMTIAGIAGICVLLCSVIAGLIPALRRKTTENQ